MIAFNDQILLLPYVDGKCAVFYCCQESDSDASTSRPLATIDIVDKNSISQKSVDAEAKGAPLAFAFSNSGSYFAVSTDYKQVLLFKINGPDVTDWELLSCRDSPKKGMKIIFQPDDSCFLMADKFGDVLTFSCEMPNDDGVVVLGHLSMLMDVTFVSGGRFIVSADRDEKIRVSHYPNAYNIQAFCLGHTSFITSVIEVGSCLASSAADGTIKLWDSLSGQLLSEIEVDTKDQFAHQMVYDQKSGILYALMTNTAKLLRVTVDGNVLCNKTYEELSAPGIAITLIDSLLLIFQQSDQEAVKMLKTPDADEKPTIVSKELLDEVNSFLSKNWSVYQQMCDTRMNFYTNLTKMNMENVDDLMEKKGKHPPPHIIDDDSNNPTKKPKVA